MKPSYVLCLLLVSVLVIECSFAKKTVNLGLKRAHGAIPNRFLDVMMLKHHSFAATPNLNMSGNVYPVGIYWANIHLGTPPQRFQVAVDSGSSDLLIPEAGCVGCHPSRTGEYNPAASSTSNVAPCRNNGGLRCPECFSSQCHFINSYETCNLTDPTQPCTVEGPLYRDTFMMGGLSAKQLAFGSIKKQSANFQQFFYIDGVMGFAFDAASSFGGVVPFQALVNANEVDDQFSMCLQAGHGGILTLGGYDSSLVTGPFQYTKLKRTFNAYLLYVIDMTDILISGKSIGVSSGVYNRNSFGGTVVDSGTNVLLLPSLAFAGVKSKIQQVMCPSSSIPGVCGSGNNLFTGECYNYNPDQISQFPTMQLDINGVKLTMQPSDYVVNNGTAGVSCLGIKDTGSLGPTIIGDTTMQEYVVLFDRQNHRLGWAPVNRANCLKGSSNN